MKHSTVSPMCMALVLLTVTASALAASWSGYGVHGGSISEAAGQITAIAGDTAGETPDYHWNKSSWATRTGEKAFYVTSDLNGLPVGAISSFAWDHVSGYWGNAYFNIMVQDAGGKRAILAPSLNSATSSGWDTDSSDDVQKPYSVFEAEAGWTGTAATGWYAANWDEVKGLTIADGPFTEFPDTLAGAATAQDDPVYVLANWAAWADQAAGYDADWEKGGVMITFGQSTGPGAHPDTTVIENLEFVYHVNSPASSAMVFEGALTDAGGGVYTGTIAATKGAYYCETCPGAAEYVGGSGYPPGPDQGGFDVYAREGATAYYDDAAQGTVGADHDAYSSAGGWGDYYQPDVADWDHYELTLTASNWYLRYVGSAGATPMSGLMNWTSMYASENDTGQYVSPPADPDANDGGAATLLGCFGDPSCGAGYWDMDWTWGSEAIPLELPGFDVDITDLGGGDYRVTLTPAGLSEVWVDASFDSSTPGWGVTHFATIQDGLNAVTGSTVHVAAGTYAESFEVSTPGVSIVGAGIDVVTIDAGGLAGHNNAGIYVSGDNVTLQGFTLVGEPSASLPRYGIKYGEVSGGSLMDVRVKEFYRSGFDFLGASNTTITGIESIDNGGHGISLVDCNGVALDSVLTSGSGWQAVSVATWGRYTPLGTSGIVFGGTNSYGNVFQLEEGDYNNPGVPPAGEAIITYSTNPADGADVTVQASEFGFALHGDQDDGPDQNRVWFFQTLAQAQAASALAPIGHLLASGIYIESLTDDTQLYVSPGGSIQAAIDAADPGDTINVAAGTYSESSIHVDKSVTISGAGMGSAVVDPAGATGFYIDADNVTMQDLTIQNGSMGLRFEMAAGTITGTTLERVEFLNNTARGIEIHNATTVADLVVSECRFESVGEVGLRVSSSGHIDGAQFLDSTFLNNDIGIYEANDGGTSTMKDVLIRGCTFEGHTVSQGTSIFLEEIQDTVIEENTFLNNRRDIQIFKWYQASVPVSNLVIRNNTMTGTTDAVFAIFNDEHSSGQTVFDGVVFENNACIGAYAAGKGPVYAGGHSAANLGGLGWDTVTIARNSFLGVVDPAVAVRFWNPGVAPDAVLGGTQLLNVSGNYWGMTDAAALDALMDVAVVTDFTPLIDNGADQSGDAGYQPDLSSLTAHALGAQSGATGRVQEAIDMTVGSTVNVAAGTYAERLMITGAIELLGANAGVDPTAAGARTDPLDESILTEAGLSDPNPNVLIDLADGVSDVSIDGFTLVGDPTDGNADTSVVRCGGSAGTADNVTIANNIMDGKQVVIYKGGSNLLFDRNRVTANKNGVVCQPNTATNAVISDSAFVLGSSPAGGEDAIHLTGTVDSHVTGNTATGFINGKGVGGSGQTNLEVSGNTFTGNKDAVSFWGDTTFVNIYNNVLSDSTRYGISIKGQDIDVIGNVIHNNVDHGVNVAKHTLDTERVVVHSNGIAGNGGLGLNVDAAVAVAEVTAVSNWWGDPSGPEDLVGTEEAGSPPCYDPATMVNADGTGDGVSDGVDYCPWLPGAGTLVLEADSCQADAYPGEAGHQIVVELWMRDLIQFVTGYEAYLQYDTGVLSYRGDLSSYSTLLAPLFAIDQPDDGALDLAANDTLGGTGTDADSLLATLVFTADAADCAASVWFEVGGSWPSMLAFEGVALDPVVLVDSPTFSVDSAVPVIDVCPADPTTAECDGAGNTAELNAWLDSFAAHDDCVTVTMDDDFTALSDECGETGSATVTFTASDDCGLEASCMATFTIEDTTPPAITGCPANITVSSDTGSCGAVVSWTEPTADDVCGLQSYTATHSPGETFGTGTTTVTYTATDYCGLEAVCSFDVTVNEVNTVNLEVELVGVTTPVTRCIHFVTDECGSYTDVSLDFVDNGGAWMSYVGPVEVPCGDWTSLCAKDAQHTLYDTTALIDQVTYYDTATVLSLAGGDTDNDSDVDILDVTWLLYQFGSLAADGGCPWDGTRDADFDNNGAVGSSDYTFLTTNWHEITTCDCLVPSPGGFGEFEAVGYKATLRTSELSHEIANRVDLNTDGVVDYRDVQRFETANGLSGDLSAKMRKAAPQEGPAMIQSSGVRPPNRK